MMGVVHGLVMNQRMVHIAMSPGGEWGECIIIMKNPGVERGG